MQLMKTAAHEYLCNKKQIQRNFFWFLIEICKYKCLFALKDKGLKV